MQDVNTINKVTGKANSYRDKTIEQTYTLMLFLTHFNYKCNFDSKGHCKYKIYVVLLQTRQ